MTAAGNGSPPFCSVTLHPIIRNSKDTHAAKGRFVAWDFPSEYESSPS